MSLIFSCGCECPHVVSVAFAYLRRAFAYVLCPYVCVIAVRVVCLMFVWGPCAAIFSPRRGYLHTSEQASELLSIVVLTWGIVVHL